MAECESRDSDTHMSLHGERSQENEVTWGWEMEWKTERPSEKGD